jgi:hypothetical protein
MDYLELSKEWRLEQKDNELYVLGGQDAIFTIELEQSTETFFANLKHGQKFKLKALDPKDQIVLEQLLSAGVITPILQKNKRSLPKVKVITKLSPFVLDKAVCKQIGGVDYDLLVLVRTSETLTEFIKEHDYLSITKPHLFLDLAYEHTISLGPLVFPGISSCIACLQGRVETRWGNHKPPPKARSVNELAGLAKDWLSIELKKLFDSEDYSLVNKTAVMDMQARTITSNKLLTVPICPYCQKSELLSTGKLEYTFAKAT